MDNLNIGFIGFGLIGGSIAKNLKLKKNYNIIAYNYYENRPNPNLEAALLDKIIDNIVTNLLDGFDKCDIIFLCAPVLTNIKYLKQLKNIIKSSCIITDVGSVKGNIQKAVKDLDLEANFIGGHPMAGSEKTGYQNSSLSLLENAFYILTPTKKTSKVMIDIMCSIVQITDAIPIILDANEHDNITACISHIPHIIASSLVNFIKHSDDSKGKMRSLTAGGFKDITRIASSSPVMWQNICLTNSDSIEIFLTKYIDYLNTIKKAITNKDEQFLLNTFNEAKEYRDNIPNNKNNLITKIFELYVDIIDETGAIANISTILANNNISIKNIGIINNREFENGVLRIEFYNENAFNNCVEILTKYKYTIYKH